MNSSKRRSRCVNEQSAGGAAITIVKQECIMEADGIDWNEVWRETQQKNIDSGHGGECWTAWQDKEAAKNYL
ncbi:MAG: hypothetical protein LBD07_05745, partial [Spirochaetaceae bacterium]|nr:hypothetical protein [Spirochaetaceae bacterium]